MDTIRDQRRAPRGGLEPRRAFGRAAVRAFGGALLLLCAGCGAELVGPVDGAAGFDPVSDAAWSSGGMASPVVAARTEQAPREDAADAVAEPAPLREYQLRPIRGPRLADGGNLTHDWGAVRIGTLVRHTFELQNRGDRPIRIRRVRPSSALAELQYDREIEPGAVGYFAVAVDTARLRPGRCSMHFDVETDDRRSDSVLMLRGNIESQDGTLPAPMARAQEGPDRSPARGAAARLTAR